MTDIKPRYDDDGVPWCDADCPKYWRGGRRIPSSCEIDQFARSPRDVCPHAVKEMTARIAELEKVIEEMPAVCAGLNADDMTRIAELEGQLHRLIRYRNGEERGSDVIEFLDKLIEEDTKRRDTEIATLRRQLAEAEEKQRLDERQCDEMTDEAMNMAVEIAALRRDQARLGRLLKVLACMEKNRRAAHARIL